MKTSRITLPIGQIMPSPLNVRKTDVDNDEVSKLEASVREKGILQPLLVYQQDDPCYFAIAGGRRLGALQAIAANPQPTDKVDVDAVPCVLIEEATEAELIEISLTENYVRADMRETEIYRAFALAQQLDESLTDKELARKFGLGLERVRRILRLAHLHPDIFEAYDRGKLSRDVAIAYASTEDQKLQGEVYARLSKGPAYQHHANQVRQAIGHGDRRQEAMLKFVGLKKFKAAGGALEVDLFSTDQPGRVLTPDILNELVEAKLKDQREALIAELGGPDKVEIHDTPPKFSQYSYGGYEEQVRQEYRDRTEEEVAALEALITERDTLATALFEAGVIDENHEPLKAKPGKRDQAKIDRLTELEAKVREAHDNRPKVWPDPEGRKIIVLNDDMKYQVYWPDKKTKQAWEKRGAKATPGGAGRIAGDTGVGGDIVLTGRARNVMQADRHRMAAAHIFDFGEDADGFKIRNAHAAYLYLMARRAGRSYTNGDGLVWDAGGSTYSNVEGQVYQPTFLEADWFRESDQIYGFYLFQQLPELEQLKVGAELLAAKIDGKLYQPNERTIVTYLSAGLNSGDLARRVWTPTAAFFEMFRKSDIIAMVKQALGRELSDTLKKKLEGAKQAAIREYALSIFTADSTTLKLLGLTKDARALETWVPAWLRFDGLDKLPIDTDEARERREAQARGEAVPDVDLASLPAVLHDPDNNVTLFRVEDGEEYEALYVDVDTRAGETFDAVEFVLEDAEDAFEVLRHPDTRRWESYAEWEAEITGVEAPAADNDDGDDELAEAAE